MATKKKTTKKETFTPEFIIDLTNATEAYDVYVAVADAKCEKYLTDTEYQALVDKIAWECPIKVCFMQGEMPKHKKNIFKRFWNWITRKK